MGWMASRCFVLPVQWCVKGFNNYNQMFPGDNATLVEWANNRRKGNAKLAMENNNQEFTDFKVNR